MLGKETMKNKTPKNILNCMDIPPGEVHSPIACLDMSAVSCPYPDKHCGKAQSEDYPMEGI